MKKNLKTFTALALAALTVTSMSSVAFAKQGDVDDNGILTANDAAMVYQYAKDSVKATEKFGSEFIAKIESMGAVTIKSLLDGNITGTDSSRILNKINGGKSFAELIAADYEDYGADYATVNADGTVTIKQVKRNADGSLYKENNQIVIEDVTYDVASDSADDVIAAIVNGTIGVSINSQAIVFTYGKTPIRVDIEDTTNDNVLDKLDTALNASANTIIAKASSLKALMDGFTVNGVSLGSEQGWARLGEIIAVDQDAFNALLPDEVDSTYVANFISNVRKAFPESNLETALANLEEFPISKSDEVSLDIDGVKYTDAKEVVAEILENVLYVDGAYDDYDFETLTLTLNGNTDSVAKVAKVEVVQ